MPTLPLMPMLARWLPWLVIALWGLPLAAALSLGVGRLLQAMGDAQGARALDYTALAGGILWVVILAGIVTLLAHDRLERRDGP